MIFELVSRKNNVTMMSYLESMRPRKSPSTMAQFEMRLGSISGNGISLNVFEDDLWCDHQ